MTTILDWSPAVIAAVIGVFMLLGALWVGWTWGRESAELEAELRTRRWPSQKGQKFEPHVEVPVVQAATPQTPPPPQAPRCGLQ